MIDADHQSVLTLIKAGSPGKNHTLSKEETDSITKEVNTRIKILQEQVAKLVTHVNLQNTQILVLQKKIAQMPVIVPVSVPPTVAQPVPKKQPVQNTATMVHSPHVLPNSPEWGR